MMSILNSCNGLRKYQQICWMLNKHSVAFYSNEKGDGNKKNTKQPQESNQQKPRLSDENLKRMDELVKRMPKSPLNIVQQVQRAKPAGYKQLQKVTVAEPVKKPKNIADAAQAVAKEVAKDRVEQKNTRNRLLESVGLDAKRIVKGKATFVFPFYELALPFDHPPYSALL